ncbi:MAG: hypothetical protein MO853_12120 [Candidatus Protistobacter heckmanni]|nr:hypothetical protein [Candidatus Protistobacter heckmanni]
MKRRQLIQAASAAREEAWPAKPIRILIGFPPGSTQDILVRAVAEHARAELGPSSSRTNPVRPAASRWTRCAPRRPTATPCCWRPAR